MIEILKDYNPISLAEMGGIRLMNRTDTKFVTTEAKLRQLLAMAAGDYLVQEIDGLRIGRYYTRYFDTPECEMFRAHQCGRLNRQKLRVRSYVDSRINFLEVKTKNNRGRTKKHRIAVEGFDPDKNYDSSLTLASSNYAGFLGQYLRYDIGLMAPKIENRFNRITLVNTGKTERLTIDTGLRFHHIGSGANLSLDGIVIIELKRDGLIPSPILAMLRELRVRPMGFSKYCIGMAMTDPGVRINRFKPRLARIGRILAS